LTETMYWNSSASITFYDLYRVIQCKLTVLRSVAFMLTPAQMLSMIFSMVIRIIVYPIFIGIFYIMNQKLRYYQHDKYENQQPESCKL